MSKIASRRGAGWLTGMIERAQRSGMENHDIAAALEGSIVFRPMAIARDDRGRLAGTLADSEVTLSDLLSLPDEDPRIR